MPQALNTLYFSFVETVFGVGQHEFPAGTANAHTGLSGATVSSASANNSSLQSDLDGVIGNDGATHDASSPSSRVL